MRPIKISQDIVPLADFKAQSASWLERIQASGQPVIITQNGKPAAVVISPEEFDRFQHHASKFVKSEIRAGEADIAAGRLTSSKEVRNTLEQRRKKKKAR
jgi:prevent-host-death family protein